MNLFRKHPFVWKLNGDGASLWTPFFLLGLAILAYGVLLPQMGFYWDDWPWIWLQHLDGKRGMLAIDRSFRPLSGVTLWLVSLIAAKQPILWQTTNFLLRWLSAVGCYLALGQVFPRQKGKIASVSALFLLYPGYTHQFVAVNSIRHLLPFGWYFLSLWLMIRNSRATRGCWLRTLGAIGFQGMGMLTTEYFYGLELLRPLFLWFALEQLSDNKERFKRTAWQALPYLVIFGLVVLWRYALTRLPNYNNYNIQWLEEGASQPFGTTLGLVFGEWLRQIYVALVAAWLQALRLPQPLTFGAVKSVAYGLLVLGGGAFAGFFLNTFAREDEPARKKGFLSLGIAALAVGGLPFLVAALPLSIAFPANRLTLPLAFGSSLVLADLIDCLPSPPKGKIVLMAMLCGFAVGAHFQNAVAFHRDWAYQRAFFEQLRWRIPQIKSGSLILSNVIAETHSSDNSLTAALNWMYFDRLPKEELPLLYFYVETRQATYFPQAIAGIQVERSYGRFTFRGNTERTLVLFFEPPACLRVVDPRLDRYNLILPREIRQVAHLSNLALIEESGAKKAMDFPLALRETADSWCYFYQKAEWARQQGRWEEVVKWGEKAFAGQDSPNRADERLPFIQAYAMTANYAKAFQLTAESVRINPTLAPLLCHLWQEIDQASPPSPAKREVLQKVVDQLKCEDN